MVHTDVADVIQLELILTRLERRLYIVFFTESVLFEEYNFSFQRKAQQTLVKMGSVHSSLS